MEKKKYSIKEDMSLLSLLLIPIAVAINYVGGQLAVLLKLPFYLDVIGTIMAAMLGGPWIGALAGLVTNLILGITNPTFLPFAIVNVAVGLVTGFCARKDYFRDIPRIILSIIYMSLISLVTSIPIVVLMFGGVTGGGTSLITGVLMASGRDIWVAVTSTEILFTGLDRIISILITFGIVRVSPPRTLVRFPCGENYIKDAQTDVDETLDE